MLLLKEYLSLFPFIFPLNVKNLEQAASERFLAMPLLSASTVTCSLIFPHWTDDSLKVLLYDRLAVAQLESAAVHLSPLLLAISDVSIILNLPIRFCQSTSLRNRPPAPHGSKETLQCLSTFTSYRRHAGCHGYKFCPYAFLKSHPGEGGVVQRSRQPPADQSPCLNVFIEITFWINSVSLISHL